MSERDFLIAVLHAAGSVPSRTMLQKLVYLMAAKLGVDLGFAPHYYGPYSRDIQAAAQTAVAAGLIEESVSRFEPWNPQPFDGRQYDYRLSSAGIDAAEHILVELKQAAAAIVTTAKSSRAWSAPALSVAAKLHYLHEVEPDAPMTNMPALAREFGWQVDSERVEEGARLISRLGLV